MSKDMIVCYIDNMFQMYALEHTAYLDGLLEGALTTAYWTGTITKDEYAFINDAKRGVVEI